MEPPLLCTIHYVRASMNIVNDFSAHSFCTVRPYQKGIKNYRVRFYRNVNSMAFYIAGHSRRWVNTKIPCVLSEQRA